MMTWNYHRDSQGRNVYHVNENAPNADYCMCNLHARNSISLSSLSSLNLSSPSSESPSPPGHQSVMEIHQPHHHGSLMLSMQYNNSYHNTSSRRSSYFASKSQHKRNRRLSGTFIPEHHLIAMPAKVKRTYFDLKSTKGVRSRCSNFHAFEKATDVF